jgi:hypothetical protein
MGLLDRLTGGDEEERSPEVRALHDAMARASNPSPATNTAFFGLLAKAHLWAITAGPAPSIAQLDAQARLTGSVSSQFRAGRTQAGEAYLPTATTRKRLLVAAHPQPGDDLIHAPFRYLAVVARYGGVPIYVNAGTVPFAYVAGPALHSFAAGGIPDPSDPAGKAVMPASRPLIIEPTDEDSVPPAVLDAAIKATQRESSIRVASLVVQSRGESKVSFIVAAVADSSQRDALTERIARQLVDAIGRENYCAVEFVTPDDPRLTDPGRAVVLVRE